MGEEMYVFIKWNIKWLLKKRKKKNNTITLQHNILIHYPQYSVLLCDLISRSRIIIISFLFIYLFSI